MLLQASAAPGIQSVWSPPTVTETRAAQHCDASTSGRCADVKLAAPPSYRGRRECPRNPSVLASTHEGIRALVPDAALLRGIEFERRRPRARLDAVVARETPVSAQSLSSAQRQQARTTGHRDVAAAGGIARQRAAMHSRLWPRRSTA